MPKSLYQLGSLILLSLLWIQKVQSQTVTLLGPPGGGKGTIGHLLHQRTGLSHVSSGDIVRSEIARGTPFGLKVQEMTAKGQLLPDTPEFIGQLFEAIKNRLAMPDMQRGFILDGIPRSLYQAHELDRVLREIHRDLNVALALNVADDVIQRRLQGRLTCSCGRTYNVHSNPPTKAGICDDCCKQLIVRADDRADVVIARLATYRAQFGPIQDYYRDSGRLVEIDGEGPPDEVLNRALKVLEGIAPPAAVSPPASVASEDGAAQYDRDYLQSRIHTYPHPEKPEIQFYNLLEIYKDPDFLNWANQQMAQIITQLNPDYIAAVEARALPFFGAVQQLTQKPGIFIRKAGKIVPAIPRLSQSYGTAYSANEMIEMVQDANLQGKSVVIIDDGISSGGTTLATVQLLEQAGMNVVHVVGLIQYHYAPLKPEFQERGLHQITTTLVDLQ